MYNPTSTPGFYENEENIGLSLNLQYKIVTVAPFTYGNIEDLTLPELTVIWNWKEDNVFKKAPSLMEDSILLFWDSPSNWVAGVVTESAYLGSGGAISRNDGSDNSFVVVYGYNKNFGASHYEA